MPIFPFSTFTADNSTKYRQMSTFFSKSINLSQTLSLGVILGVDFENRVEKLIRGESRGQNLKKLKIGLVTGLKNVEHANYEKFRTRFSIVIQF